MFLPPFRPGPEPEEIVFLPGKQAQSAAQKGKNRQYALINFYKQDKKKGCIVAVVHLGPVIAFEF